MQPKTVYLEKQPLTTDTQGSPIAAIKLDPKKAYDETSSLLQHYINENDLSAWKRLTQKIDYLYESLDNLLSPLQKETSFYTGLQEALQKNKKLLFKPSLADPMGINSEDHGIGSANILGTSWLLIAALMRWFHDHLNIPYYQMCLGEASSTTFYYTSLFTKFYERKFTPQALLEGRNGDFYGGWGFYFVRRYLSDRHPSNHTDDPMNGYEESLSGCYLPPGKSGNRLLLYDLNQAEGDAGRTVAVPNGVNFSEITLHKAIVGGNPDDLEDLENYPGCILINVPILKIHAQDLITNAIKNLGIGLYPNKAPTPKSSGVPWKYAYPNNDAPTLKARLPHSPWVFKMDEDTLLPLRDKNGHYISTKTGGFSGTQTDIIALLQSLNIPMLHLSEALYVDNFSHNDSSLASHIPEGYLFASHDCVALDLFCARYCFNTVSMKDSLPMKNKYHWSTEFVQKVPIAIFDKRNICTDFDFDSPLFRYPLYDFAEKRGLGHTQYYVIGLDTLTNCPLASVQGHLGRLQDNSFIELITHTLYYNFVTFLHDLQKSCFTYAKCHDKLFHTCLYQTALCLFDENKDNIIDYDEKGRGIENLFLLEFARLLEFSRENPLGFLKQTFFLGSYVLQYSNPAWNPYGHDFSKELSLVHRFLLAYQLSCHPEKTMDHFIPGMSYGQGNWPSLLTVNKHYMCDTLYGSSSPKHITLYSMYGCAFQFADKTFNDGLYTRTTNFSTNTPNSRETYLLSNYSGTPLLPFMLYVPAGYALLQGQPIPNVAETDDPTKMFTAMFTDPVTHQTAMWLPAQ